MLARRLWKAIGVLVAVGALAGCMGEVGGEDLAVGEDELRGGPTLGFVQDGAAVTSVASGSLFDFVGSGYRTNGSYYICTIGGNCLPVSIDSTGSFSLANSTPAFFGNFFGYPCPGNFGCYPQTYTIEAYRSGSWGRRTLMATAPLTVY